jgi:hypothetical protein
MVPLDFLRLKRRLLITFFRRPRDLTRPVSGRLASAAVRAWPPRHPAELAWLGRDDPAAAFLHDAWGTVSWPRR